MWYGQVGDHVVRALDQVASRGCRGRRPRPAAGCRLLLGEARRAGAPPAARSTSTAVTRRRARAARRSGRPRPGPISRIRLSGRVSASSTMSSRTCAVDEVVLAAALARRQAVLAQVALDALGPTGARRRASSSPPPSGRARVTASLSDGSAVEVAPGARPGAQPEARRPRRSSPRCPCTARAAARRAGCQRAAAPSAIRWRRTLFAATPPPSTIVRAPLSSRSAQRLGRQHVDDRLLEGRTRARPPPSRAGSWPSTSRPSTVEPELRGDLAPRGGLQAAEREVERVAQPGAREAPVMARRSSGRGHDRRAARIRQAEQPADLVERLPCRVVDRLAEQSVAQVVASSRRGTCARR